MRSLLKANENVAAQKPQSTEVGVERSKAFRPNRDRTSARIESYLLVAGLCAIALLLSFSFQAFAQTGGALPGTTVEPATGGGSGASSTPPGEEAAPAEPGAEATPPKAAHAPTTHHAATHATHHVGAAHEATGAVEPANAKLKLKQDSWAYASPAKSSKHIEHVQAGKFVNVTGTTRYYVQVRLKSGTTAYVPISAVELTRPADKVFMLTTNASVVSEPNRYGKKLSEVHRGHNVHVIGIALNYVKIRMRDGLEGYVPLTALQ